MPFKKNISGSSKYPSVPSEFKHTTVSFNYIAIQHDYFVFIDLQKNKYDLV